MNSHLHLHLQRILLSIVLLLPVTSAGAGKTIQFGGYDWSVRSGRGGPGPNLWDGKNVWLDSSGNLHMKIAQHDEKWSCAEITMQKRLGYGQYEFEITGAIDALDDNVVLGLFNYPTRDVGTDATHEIDIEFARWGAAKNPIGNHTVWPVDAGLKQTSKSFSFTLESPDSTHRFDWSARRIQFQSFHGHRKEGGDSFSQWTFSPANPGRHISTQPMPMHINLWLFKELAPKNGKEVEVVLRSFNFTPE